MKNTFEEVNRARCFNYTLQLSAKTLLKPFNVGMSSAQMAVDEEETPRLNDEVPTLLDDDAGGDDEDDNDEGFYEENLGDDEEPDNKDGNEDGDGIDELEHLDEEEREKILADTAVVRQTISKV
jgi:hypothetical protein